MVTNTVEDQPGHITRAADSANVLVRALEKFVVPLIHSHITSGPETVDNVMEYSRPGDKVDAHSSNYNILPPEAKQFLVALERFVNSLMHRDPRVEERHKTNVPDESQTVIFPEVKAQEGGTEADTEMEIDSYASRDRIPVIDKTPNLQLALDKAHQAIFDSRPIRLLSLNSDGTGIELVERADIWRRISKRIEHDFDDEVVNSTTHRLVYYEGKDQETARDAACWNFVSNYVEYAILSHTWLQEAPGEVTYGNWKEGVINKASPGYAKLTHFCRIAAIEHGLTLAWMDTICINKDSSAELDESIRSMYMWYRASAICLAYLADTVTQDQIPADTWFTRGWTLQELIAPHRIKFYNATWIELAPYVANDRTDAGILSAIHSATTITESELALPLGRTSLSRRMQWAANRRVTRNEDTAYSLMGLFGVSIATAYGEGAARAFVRLVREILNTGTPNALDLVNWGYGPTFPPPMSVTIQTSSLIPWSPKFYAWRAEEDIKWYRPKVPITLTQLGLCVPVLMMPALRTIPKASFVSSSTFEPQGSYSAVASDVHSVYADNDVIQYTYNILDRAIFQNQSSMLNSSPRDNISICGTLNITETKTAVKLPENGLCFAVMLDVTPSPVFVAFSEDVKIRRLVTMKAITFNIVCHGTSSLVIPKSELKQHGMTLRTLYL